MKKIAFLLVAVIISSLLLASCDIDQMVLGGSPEDDTLSTLESTFYAETDNFGNQYDDSPSDDDSEDDDEWTTREDPTDKENATEEEPTTEKYTFNGEENTTDEEFTTAKDTEVADAVTDYLFTIYDNAIIDSGSYDFISHIRMGDVYVPITWSIEGTDKVTIVKKDDNFVTLIVPEVTEELRYFLRAEFQYGDIGSLVKFAHTVKAN